MVKVLKSVVVGPLEPYAAGFAAELVGRHDCLRDPPAVMPPRSRCACALSECVAHHRVAWCMSSLPVICVVNGLTESGLRKAGWRDGASPGTAWLIGPPADRGACWSRRLLSPVGRRCRSERGGLARAG